MPIPIAQLEDAQRSIGDRAVAFLQKESEQAYTVVEIYAALNNLDAQVLAMITLLATRPSNALERLQSELDLLVKAGKLRTALIGGITYYGIAK